MKRRSEKGVRVRRPQRAVKGGRIAAGNRTGATVTALKKQLDHRTDQLSAAERGLEEALEQHKATIEVL